MVRDILILIEFMEEYKKVNNKLKILLKLKLFKKILNIIIIII